MLFNSINFGIFFILLFFTYYALPAKVRPWLLLLASCLFYMAFVPKYILVLFVLIIVDYVLGLYIERADSARRRVYFIAGVVFNVGLLFVFKYFNFFNENIAALADLLHWNYSPLLLSVLLPLGLSFHIFQSLSYLTEVYKRRYAAERNLRTYALYIMFFPQLVAGPIERPAQLLPQLSVSRVFNYAQVVSGLRLMLWGFFKKIVVANNLAIIVDFIFARSGTADASVLFVGVVAFSFQLYADFSGYCDIAVGSARMLGIELVQNFRQPYFSRSIAELWRRWHVSLSLWFRDYVFYPLALWKPSRVWLYSCIFITFILTGLWHGAGWTFLCMGLLFGFYIVFGQITKPWRQRAVVWMGLRGWLHIVVQVATTFILTTLAWVFFRAESISQAFEVFWGLFFRWGSDAFSFLRCSDYCSFYHIGVGRKDLLLIALSVLGMLMVEYLQQANALPKFLQRRPVLWGAYYVCVIWILTVGYFAPKTFIYFQF